jgi:ATP-dependent RNA helicase RhlB
MLRRIVKTIRHRLTAARRAPRAPAAPAPEPASPPPWTPALFRVPPREGSVRFHDLHLPDEILHAVADLGFQYCTPIQAAILPKILNGVDAAGRAQTGTGKTAAFLISLFARLLRHPAPSGRRHGSPRALILAPTRELTMQIEQEARGIGRYCPLYVMAVFGGVDFDKQRRQLEQRVVDVLVATPGRLLDFRQRHILHLNHVEVLVIDEADRMLDMGFIPDVRRIVGCTPPKASRQTLLFSATLTAPVVKLAAQWTRDPVRVEIEPERVAVATVKQMVYIITAREKFDLLYNLLTRRCGPSTLVFANRRDEARELKGRLWSLGIRCALLSGEVPQEKRIRTLRDFREGRIPVVVATDVAARGLHVEGIGHVINYNLPDDPEDYVHRIGRTGRAGASGVSISFACEEDSFAIPDIEKYLGHDLLCTHPEDELLAPAPAPVHGLHPRAEEPHRHAHPHSKHGRRPRRRSGRSS